MPNKQSIIPWSLLTLAIMAVGHCTWVDAGWEEWKTIPTSIQGSYSRFAGEIERLGPENITLTSKSIRYRSYAEDDHQWMMTNSKICGGSSYRDNLRHNIWLPDCGWGNHIEIIKRTDGNIEIREFVILSRTAGTEDDERLLWQGVYKIRNR